MIKIAIVGSRDYDNLIKVRNTVRRIPRDFIIVSGGGGNVDRNAILMAKKLKMKNKVLLPDWEQYGKSAGPRRNSEIVAYCDYLIAFWDGASKGTFDSIKKAASAGKFIDDENLTNNSFESLRPWKSFKMKEITEAEEFALQGGIAVHLMGSADPWLHSGKSKQVLRAFSGKDFAHLFGPSVNSLSFAAKSIGCNTKWIQHPENPKRMHFDITGKILSKAIRRCKDNEK